MESFNSIDWEHAAFSIGVEPKDGTMRPYQTLSLDEIKILKGLMEKPLPEFSNNGEVSFTPAAKDASRNLTRLYLWISGLEDYLTRRSASNIIPFRRKI